MKSFRHFLSENTSALFGFFDEASRTLRITRANGQTFNVKSPEFSGVRVFGVTPVNDSINVYVGPLGNPQPLRILKFSNSGIYVGSSAIIA